MMRKIIFSAAGLAALLLFSLSGCAVLRGQDRQNSAQAQGAELFGALTGELLDGVYEGSARGHRGNIHVQVRMEGGSIAQIDIIDSGEDQFVGGAAIEELLELALIYNTADLDAISGATESSEGFLAALADALGQARQ
jgi:fumarate reductase flavoprotein subunit